MSKFSIAAFLVVIGASGPADRFVPTIGMVHNLDEHTVICWQPSDALDIGIAIDKMGDAAGRAAVLSLIEGKIHTAKCVAFMEKTEATYIRVVASKLETDVWEISIKDMGAHAYVPTDREPGA